MKIYTTHGLIEEDQLRKVEGLGWIEYWLGGELVHRSAVGSLQQHVPLSAPAGAMFEMYGYHWEFK